MDLAALDLAGVDVPDLIAPDLLPICKGIIVTTLAGNGTAGDVDGTGGPNGTTEFHFPSGIAVDALGNVYIGEPYNERIRKLAADGSTSTVAGNGVAGLADGTGGASGTAQFNRPSGVAVDTLGNLYVADNMNHAIRQIAPDGTTTTLAGGRSSGFSDGDGCEASFTTPFMLAVRGRLLFVADALDHRVRKIQLP